MNVYACKSIIYRNLEEKKEKKKKRMFLSRFGNPRAFIKEKYRIFLEMEKTKQKY